MRCTLLRVLNFITLFALTNILVYSLIFSLRERHEVKVIQVSHIYTVVTSFMRLLTPKSIYNYSEPVSKAFQKIKLKSNAKQARYKTTELYSPTILHMGKSPFKCLIFISAKHAPCSNYWDFIG